MNYTPPPLAFPGTGILEDIIGGAAGNIADDIFTSITGWILTSAFSIFAFAVELAFSNDGITAGCDASIANIEGCANNSFISSSFQQSLWISISIAGIGFIFTVIKTMIQGDPGELARKALLSLIHI